MSIAPLRLFVSIQQSIDCSDFFVEGLLLIDPLAIVSDASQESSMCSSLPRPDADISLHSKNGLIV